MTKVRLILLSLLALLFASCERDGVDTTLTLGPFGKETRKVMLFYEAGFNNLSGDLARNVAALKRGYLPEKSPNDDVLLVFTHNTRSYGDYKSNTAPVLVRLYADHGEARADTLKAWPEGASIANAAMVTDVFNWVKNAFPAAGYGAVMASHASGWLPEGYYDNPEKHEGYNRGGGGWSWAPRQKTFGHEFFSNGTMTEEIEIKDLAKAIPYKLDYLVFDACLMGSVEVAWELRNVCSYLVVSPFETPAAGFDYKSMAERLLKPETPDPTGVAQDYFAAYENDSIYGATITVVDCGALDPLASVCSTLFDRYRSGIRNLVGKNVQVYDRSHGSKYYYALFDLKDMLREAGASAEDLASLQQALDKAIVFEAHTKQFLSVNLDRCCGLSVYLPAYPDYQKDLWHGTEFLDTFYKQHLSWNAATHLVE